MKRRKRPTPDDVNEESDSGSAITRSASSKSPPDRREYHHDWYNRHKRKVRKQQRIYLYKKTNQLSSVKIPKTPPELLQKNRDYKHRIRKEVFSHYSPNLVCQRCGFSDFRALSLDHINGGGREHERLIQERGDGIMRWLRKNNYPAGYQVLCMNCQFIKRCENKEYFRRSFNETPNG